MSLALSFTFQLASFLIGALFMVALSWVGYQIIAVVEQRRKEENQWRQALSRPSPSEEYWMSQLRHPSSADEVSPTSRTASSEPVN